MSQWAHNFHNTGEEEKKPYNESYAADHASYKEAMAEFKRNLADRDGDGDGEEDEDDAKEEDMDDDE